MTFPTIGRHLGTAALALSALTLAGCAAFAPSTPEEAVQQRATEYWKTRIAGDYEKSYALSTPSYRKVRSVEQFKRQFGPGVSVLGADVVKVVCEPVKCVATLKLSANAAVLGGKTMSTHMTEVWLLEDGQWWHHQEL